MLQPVTFGPKQMIHNSIWRFPEMGVLLNHPFLQEFPF